MFGLPLQLLVQTAMLGDVEYSPFDLMGSPRSFRCSLALSRTLRSLLRSWCSEARHSRLPRRKEHRGPLVAIGGIFVEFKDERPSISSS